MQLYAQRLPAKLTPFKFDKLVQSMTDHDNNNKHPKSANPGRT